MTMLGELRVTLRRLAKEPRFAAVAILVLALGIGAHVAIFSLINVLFLQPLPLPDAGALVGIYETRNGAGYHPLSYPDYVDHRHETKVFAGLAAHYPTAPLVVEIGDDSHEMNGSVVSGNYFSLLGIEPALGRFFLPEEDAIPGAHPVAVVSHELWRSRLGGGEDLKGATLKINGTTFTVAGVAPESFKGLLRGRPSHVWIPTMMSRVGYRWCDTFSRDCTWLNMVGRLKPGRTVEEAQAEMDLLGRRTAEMHADWEETRSGLAVEPLQGVHPAMQRYMGRLARLLLYAVTLLLVVAGANLSGLLVARSLTRRKEIALRFALGGSRRDVVSRSLAETLLLAIAGGACGLLVARALGRVVALLYPSQVPIDLGLGPPVLVYATLVSLLTGALVGGVSGLQAARPDLVTSLKEEVTLGGRGRPRLLGLFVVVQVALSFVLLTSTGLLVKSLQGARAAGDLDPDSVVTVRLRPRLLGYEPERAQALSREVVDALAALPGVESVTLATRLPPGHPHGPYPVGLPGEGPRNPERGPRAWVNQIGPRFFETFNVPLLKGRDFDERDGAGGAPVAVVNQTLASALWPRAEVIGRTLLIDHEPYRVVGVVQDAGYRTVTEEASPQAYLSYWQNPANVDARVAVRSSRDALQLVPALRRTIREVDAGMPVSEIGTMSERLEEYLAQVHIAARVLGVSGLLALILSALGLYGVVALAVAQQTRDIGIRMALGGSRSRVVAQIVRGAMILVATALGLGIAASLAVSRLLAHHLYGVSPYDPLAYLATLAVLALIAALASWWPARRAAGVDPMISLRRL